MLPFQSPYWNNQFCQPRYISLSHFAIYLFPAIAHVKMDKTYSQSLLTDDRSHCRERPLIHRTFEAMDRRRIR